MRAKNETLVVLAPLLRVGDWVDVRLEEDEKGEDEDEEDEDASGAIEISSSSGYTSRRGAEAVEGPPEEEEDVNMALSS